MKTIQKLESPFDRMICSLGVIPTSYKQSLSYEEQIIWFCKYLEETILPAINNNAEAYEELEALYNQVYEYITTHTEQEVREYMDILVENGTMDQLLNTNVTGSLENLQTTDKTSLVNAINEVNSKLNYKIGEEIVIGKYNNKTLYRRVINTGDISWNNGQWISSEGILLIPIVSSISKIINYEFTAIDSNGLNYDMKKHLGYNSVDNGFIIMDTFFNLSDAYFILKYYGNLRDNTSFPNSELIIEYIKD